MGVKRAVASRDTPPDNCNTGGVVSRTATLKLPVLILRSLSVAVQFTVVAPKGNVLPEGGVQFTVVFASTSSVALTAYCTTDPAAALASTVRSPDTVKRGAVVSPIVMVKLPELALPAASRAVQLMVVWPSGNVLPEGGVHETVAAETKSLALTV